MANQNRALPIPFQQEAVWQSVRMATIRPKEYKGEAKMRKGLQVFAIEVIGIHKPDNRSYGRGADYYSISVPLDAETAEKIKNSPADTELVFEGLVAWNVEGRQYFTAEFVTAGRKSVPTLPQVK